MDERPSGNEEHRRAPRSNLFLAATIEAAGSQGPVRIRNLSETGAMIEGPGFPPVGARLVLRRQEVEMAGEVMWIDGPRCGLHFDDKVAVADWIAGKRSRPVFGQARVDMIQSAIRRGEAAPEALHVSASASGSEAPAGSLDEKIARELEHVRRLFKEVSEALIHDPAVVERHARLLQNFDIGDQMLGHLTRIVAAPDRDTAVRAVGMEELRARLLRKG